MQNVVLSENFIIQKFSFLWVCSIILQILFHSKNYDYKRSWLPRTISRRNAWMVQKPEWGRTRNIWGGLDRNADSVHSVHEKEERVNTAKQLTKDAEEKFSRKKSLSETEWENIICLFPSHLLKKNQKSNPWTNRSYWDLTGERSISVRCWC